MAGDTSIESFNHTSNYRNNSIGTRERSSPVISTTRRRSRQVRGTINRPSDEAEQSVGTVDSDELIVGSPENAPLVGTPDTLSRRTARRNGTIGREIQRRKAIRRSSEKQALRAL